MSRASRGNVVPFRRPGNRLRGTRGAPEEGANPTSHLGRDTQTEDAAVNTSWDRLLALLTQAWCWRDPESIEALWDCVREIESIVEREWS